MRAQLLVSEVSTGLRRNLTMTIAVIVTVAIAAFVWWAETPYQPTENALTAMKSGDGVDVLVRDGFVVFTPQDDEPRIVDQRLRQTNAARHPLGVLF